MNFNFDLPKEEINEDYADIRFLPSVAFTVFETDTAKSLKTKEKLVAYSRRIPHIMKIKSDLLNRFRSILILPIKTDKYPFYYVDTDKETFWQDPNFLINIDYFDYIISGKISLEQDKLTIYLYSFVDDQIIYQRDFFGDFDDYFDFCNQFMKEIFMFFEFQLGKKDLDILENRPVQNKMSLDLFIQALETDPDNNTQTSDEKKFVKFEI